ncbi:MAG: adenosylcobinamide-GDP ribazoletransferase, partial [Blastocatellia bacterium]|nr:adenosylcobinamide-GDP ribazoletransferase [Blastocatellia bacterium]
GLLFLVSFNLLPLSTSVLVVVIYSAFITNGFHEDGLADAFDGFGGGWKKDDVLRIMRDSRIGTFGSLALIFLILAKYNLLTHIAESSPKNLFYWYLLGQTAGRWTVLPLCFWLPYAVADDPSSQGKGQGGLVARRIGGKELLVGSLTLCLPLLLLPLTTLLLFLAVVSLVVFTTGTYYRKRVNGVTGDALGATNQLTEVATYLLAVILTTAERGLI